MLSLNPKSITSYTTPERHNAVNPLAGHYICVYGTLRQRLEQRCRWRGSVLAGLEFVGMARINRIGMFVEPNPSFPFAVVTHDPEHYLLVEQYYLGPTVAEVMSTLDAIEGAPHFYHRTCVRIVGEVDRWLYTVGADELYNPTHVKSGDWQDVLNQEVEYELA